MQRILAVLEQKSNMSISDLSTEAFVGVSTLACGGYIRALIKQRLIYISGWRKQQGRFTSPLFSLGNHENVVRPRIDETNRSAPGMFTILETLKKFGPLSYREIAEYSGLSKNTVKNSGYLEALIAQDKIHISSWKRARNGPMSAVYSLGHGMQAAKPLPRSPAEKNRLHRHRIKLAAQGQGLSGQLARLASAME